MQTAESESRRGKLKIFFGYVAGVGKTFAMLEAAQRERADGVDVVVGYVEPHGRAETEALLQGLEVLPPRLVTYRGVTLRELDLDAALARRPQLILVDELAHTNAAGLRHAKRWQDVEELLEAGIDVYTTLNVQHVESLNDVIAQITGVVVRETLPDSVVERADDIELIDLTPEGLIERLKEGKVYLPQQAQRALQHYFQKANLQALRELALRQAAHRLRKDVEAARKEKAVQTPWATEDRLLVCVGPSPTTAKLIRATKRMAAGLGAEWLAVAVATPGSERAAPAVRAQLAEHLRLAEQLGAETHVLVGAAVAETILKYAHERNVTKIVVGKTAQAWWRKLFFGAVVNQLLERSGDIDVYVIAGEGDSPRPAAAAPQARPIPWRGYAFATAIIAACGVLGWLSTVWDLSVANIAILFPLGVTTVAYTCGRGPAAYAALLGVLVFDFVCVPPYWSFAVSDTEYLLTFLVMLLIGLLISSLTVRLRDQLLASQRVEQRTAALYRLTRQMSEVAGPEFLIGTAGKQLGAIFEGEVVIYTRGEPGLLTLSFGQQSSVAQHYVSPLVAQWVADHDQIAGAGTTPLPNATAFFVPMIGSQRTVGALGVKPAEPQRFLDPEQRRLLETCASLIALSMERDQSVLAAHQAQLQVQTEQLRNSLLSSVSHDLRTPLAAIAGASSTLLDSSLNEDGSDRRELLQTIADESRRLARLVDNLLDMTRLEAGSVFLNIQWHVLEEIVGSARVALRDLLAQHVVRSRLPADLPLILVDGVLLEQVFITLLENAGRYTPAGSVIEISAQVVPGAMRIEVTDDGPGLAPGTESQAFRKFFRGGVEQRPDRRRGVGLGLAICRAIVEAHGGSMTAHNRPQGGAAFVMMLPCREPAPRVALDESATVAGSAAL